MSTDRSEGWEQVAGQFMAIRSDSGAALVSKWALAHLPPAGSIVDVGCGSGAPIAEALVAQGFAVFGIDASPTLIGAFRRRFPDTHTVCEPAQDSAFFHRRFDGAIAVGLLFLLAAEDQRAVLQGMAKTLLPGGRLLFSAPRQVCEWDDLLTGRRSQSLGEAAYHRLLEASGLRVAGHPVDAAGSQYYDAIRPRA